MSQIERYEGDFSSLSAFLLAAKPQVADVERMEEQGVGELLTSAPFEATYRTEEGHPSSLSLTENVLLFRRGFSEMSFEKGGVTRFTYRTGYGELDTEVFTDLLSLTEREGKWLLSLAYYARMGDVVQRNTMRFIFTPKK